MKFSQNENFEILSNTPLKRKQWIEFCFSLQRRPINYALEYSFKYWLIIFLHNIFVSGRQNAMNFILKHTHINSICYLLNWPAICLLKENVVYFTLFNTADSRKSYWRLLDARSIDDCDNQNALLLHNFWPRLVSESLFV